ncbi:hypothetical protein PO878_04105 [Iamia majanohamensis]|uniref:Phosphoadenosine phosphosulphate reductase domain-containing protein n=1 Tax=Iamia majanohamensis TaxID=467976 RepID=A0AAE9Y8V8_9ACTN|nr:hypothetical protein [Iamia majanohamensis]WCO67906.1 hypothetical protein PO878_04105 [Iamia majanohamensis]
MSRHLVQFSTGAGSAEVAFRVAERNDPADVVLITADTLVEDDDNWRFARDVVHALPDGVQWVRLTDGRTPMQVGRDQRVVPNNRMAVCSRVLKRDLIRAHMDANYDPEESVVYLGFDWTEEHRMAASAGPWAPWTVAAPLMDPPYRTKAQILDGLRARGIEPPRLYAAGFSHANCGGGCVRGGQAQWELLLRRLPDRYREWETEEEATRALLGKDVSILRDRRGGTAVPLPLRSFRERLEAQPSLFDNEDWGACGCGMEAAS